MLKGIASDIDGTLIFNNEFREDDLKKIEEFQKNGHLFGLCSGRPVGSVLQTMPSSIQPDFYIAVSGAIILDKDKKVLEAHILEYNQISEIYHLYKDKSDFVVQTTNPNKFYTTFNQFKGFPGVHDFKDISELKEEEILGISLINISQIDASIYCETINATYPNLIGFQNGDSVDIVSHKASKGNACKYISDYLHLDFLAGIGDNYNDVPMLDVVDVSFTFHNSPTDMKEKVNYVVDSVSEALDILTEIGVE